MVKRIAVSAAPYQTGRQGSFTSGRYLKISANRQVITPIDTIALTMFQNAPMPSECTTADSTVLITSETSRRNAVPSTRVSERKRCLTIAMNP